MRLLIILALLLTTTITHAQDNITLRNGEEIPAKVLEVSQTELKYIKSGNLEGPTYTAPLRDVLFIKYANGTKDTFGATSSPSMTRPADANRPDRPNWPNRFNRPNRLNRMAPSPQPGVNPGLESLRYHSRLFSGHYTTANGQRIGMSEAKSVFSVQPDALNALNRGRSFRCWSMATAIPAVVMIGAGAGLMAFEGKGWGRGRDRMRNEKTGITKDDDNDDRKGHHKKAIVGAAVAGGGVLLGVVSAWLDHRATVQFKRAANRYNSRAVTSLRFVPSRLGVGVGAVLMF